MILKCARLNIAETGTAIRAGGLAGEPMKITFDIYPANAEETLSLLQLRGKPLVAVFVTLEEAEKLQQFRS